MNNFKFEIKGRAYSDMEAIFDYIAKDNKNAAKKLVEKFYKTFELICSQPDCGRIIEKFQDKNIRFFVVKKRYLVIYKKSDSAIQIIRVLTGYEDVYSLI